MTLELFYELLRSTLTFTELPHIFEKIVILLYLNIPWFKYYKCFIIFSDWYLHFINLQQNAFYLQKHEILLQKKLKVIHARERKREKFTTKLRRHNINKGKWIIEVDPCNLLKWSLLACKLHSVLKSEKRSAIWKCTFMEKIDKPFIAMFQFLAIKV